MAKPDPILLDTGRYPNHYQISTRYQDIDPNQHVNNVAMATLFEDARVRFDWSLGLREVQETFGVRTMIASLHVEYLAESFYPDPMEMHIGILDVGRSSWSLGTVAAQGDRIAAFSKAVIVNLKDGRPSPLPGDFRETLLQKRIRV